MFLKDGVKRRTVLGMAMAAGLAGGMPAAQAADDIVLGGSIPLTGVFAFAGEGIHAGIQDYVEIVNNAGGIEGRMIKYVPEDTAYKVDASVAAFNKITSQYDTNFYYGDSTGFAKTISPELDRKGTILMAGASFASELNDPEKHRYQFMAGPDYTEMINILLEYIADENPGAKVAYVHSDTEFGRDPIETSQKRAEELGLEVVETIVTKPGSVDVSTEVLKLRRAQPDYTIFHGYVLAPIPEFINQAKQMGMETKFMGTFWSMDNSMVMKMGEAGDGFMGVMPYAYYYDDSDDAPMLEKIREMRPEYQSTAYMQGFLTAMLMTESAKRTLEAGKELNGDNLKAALNSIEDFDTGGIIGVPISIPGNSIPVGRIYRADMSQEKMVPASDWIRLE
ncbi:ABC transporter substrate-binding protein [Marivibrio halodurans]|uniref:ABC transporter substrate-binding protein n=1 Tax=Marivibrio halodurans TaxID=2039722 RepID=A0A8J7RWI5_9PROT|nr:ABC transporter substrate-binding protein [Marivibrio halodurans]MBP5856007.1 ABC transporter substrate-binding protein [Marivibrio halodurans]